MNRLLAYSPNLKQSWMLLGIYFVCMIVEPLTDAIMRNIGIATPEWVGLSGTVFSYVALALIVVRLGKNDDSVPAAVPGLSPFLWLLLIPFTLSVNFVASSMTEWIPVPDFLERMMAEVFRRDLPAFLEIVIIAPVCEEWLCRGIILKGLMTRFSPLKSIVWSGVIFGTLHLNLWQFVTAFFFAAAAGWIYWRTRSLWRCIFMHVVNNAAVFLLMALFPDVTSSNASMADSIGISYVCLYIIVLFTGTLSWMGIKHIISSGANAKENCNGTRQL